MSDEQQNENAAAPEQANCAVGAGSALSDRTQYPQHNPSGKDIFCRDQIIAYLEQIPLGYRTQRDHEVIEAFVNRAQRHFAELSNMWEPSND